VDPSLGRGGGNKLRRCASAAKTFVKGLQRRERRRRGENPFKGNHDWSTNKNAKEGQACKSLEKTHEPLGRKGGIKRAAIQPVGCYLSRYQRKWVPSQGRKIQSNASEPGKEDKLRAVVRWGVLTRADT